MSAGRRVGLVRTHSITRFDSCSGTCLLQSRGVVMAGRSWTSKHIVRDLPASHREAYAQFYRSPCLMANVAVRPLGASST